ncbi:putative RNA 3''-terminal phosphate cyclase-like protein [Schizosaccharomyces pombe]|uniref:rRNA processing protein rcl1 n=1 Tax=Schizosaccharomyces pombe (strain 972 / ATCC 24843) TaxID=284812 RepID=RCL1_SCHPO|nr:putative rRNA processing protein [Schizosaccharomyces pombe]Q09870.1 RecName: Full=Probable RNA 3'-terminal phosphate cyclase-like protein [Schizosaccharomyces pombe 972h-]CAA91501.1 rRNA processing protein (predicted) [Schizosaccharomyces pombe]|eukprot:NP_592892.1 putative rRNA processing protein [Schizosaccharomyces pombe]
MSTGQLKRFKGCEYLTHRLVLATLSGTPIRVEGIYPDEADPGVKDYQVSFLRLLEKLTNGSVIEISYTGTSFIYRPGNIIGGRVVHDCPTTKGIGYFLEPILILCLFAKTPTSLTLTGVTSSNEDIGVDVLRTSVLPSLQKRFQVGDELELRILKRGSAPGGGGEVNFLCPVIKESLPPIRLSEFGRVFRIRGIASSTRVSPAFANRLVESARGVLNPFIPDVFIYTDVRRGDECGNSPGYSITLVAETNKGCSYAAEHCGEAGETPEDVGSFCAKKLLEVIESGGCVDPYTQPSTLTGMLLSSEDVNTIVVGQLGITSQLVVFLRDVKALFNCEYRFKELESGQVEMSCLGKGYLNVNRRIQ